MVRSDTRTRSDTRKYRIRRKKVSKKIRRGGEGVVAQRVQSIERRNNPLYNKPFTQKAKKQKSSPIKSSTKRIYSPNLRKVGSRIKSETLPTYNPPPAFSPEKSPPPPRASPEKSLSPVVNVPVQVSPTRRQLVRGNKENVIVTPILPGYYEALEALDKLELFLETKAGKEKPLSIKSSQRKKTLSPTIPAEIQDLATINNHDALNNEISKLITKGSVSLENREEVKEVKEEVTNMITESSQSVSTQSRSAGPPLSVKKEKKVRRKIFEMWSEYIKSLLSRLKRKSVKRVERTGAMKKSNKSNTLRGMAPPRGLTNEKIPVTVNNPISSASLESNKSVEYTEGRYDLTPYKNVDFVGFENTEYANELLNRAEKNKGHKEQLEVLEKEIEKNEERVKEQQELARQESAERKYQRNRYLEVGPQTTHEYIQVAAEAE